MRGTSDVMTSVDIFSSSTAALSTATETQSSAADNAELDNMMSEIEPSFADLKGGMFDDLDTSVGDAIDGSLEESVSSSESSHDCKLCK